MRDDINLEYKGKTYTVKGNELLPLICEIEEIITTLDIARMMDEQNPRFGKIAKAFTVALEYAGAKNVDPNEIFETMGTPERMQQALMALAYIMSPVIPDFEIDNGEPAPTGKKKKKSNT